MEDALRSRRHELRVVAVRPVSASMRRVTLDAGELAALPLRPAMDLGLMLSAADYSGAIRPVRRRYTIVAADPARGTLALDGILHGHGPGARWFAEVAVGATVEAVGPRGGIEAANADWQLLVGDESGLPAFTELLRHLGPGVRATAVIEVGGPGDEMELMSGADVHTQWIHRGDQPAGRRDRLGAALSALRAPAGRGQAYLLGESRAVASLRTELSGLGLVGDAVFVKGYWNAVPLRAGRRPSHEAGSPASAGAGPG